MIGQIAPTQVCGRTAACTLPGVGELHLQEEAPPVEHHEHDWDYEPSAGPPRRRCIICGALEVLQAERVQEERTG